MKKTIIKNHTFTVIISLLFTVSLWAQETVIQQTQTSRPIKNTNNTVSNQNTIDLSGLWTVKLEPQKNIHSSSLERKLEGMIELPGSLAENGFGYKTEGRDIGVLTPEYKYIGKASYSKQITIPKSWKNKELQIKLERVLWESRVFIDGKEISRQDALGTPHYHELGNLNPGKHTLKIIVDNNMIHNIGDKAHAYSDYTQSIWNGIVGKMEIRAYDPLRILVVKTIPDIAADQLTIEYHIKAAEKQRGKISWHIAPLNSETAALRGEKKVDLKVGLNPVSIKIGTVGKLKNWIEFTPQVYVLRTLIQAGDYKATNETEFGYYQVSHNGTKILINGNPIFLRGNLDNVHFPLTGYPSCKLEDWERIFRIYKEYGLNHVRFHSWCPPEAAFKAANRIGIYIQAEGSIWIDSWMTDDMMKKGRPDMKPVGPTKGLGYDKERDKFVVAEMNRVVAEYGNNPSFIMFCIGNELGNSDFDVMGKWIADLKSKDSRRLYAASTARKITPYDDFIATHYIQGLGRTRGLNGATTDWDFEDVYSKMNIPVIAHEIGQWPVYPQWSEIDKYKGVLKVRNFEAFKLLAEKNGIADQDVDFAMASGALSQIMYKYETESFFRTKSCAGIQLLSMQDYQGQGEALIGWLDCFWESKGITTPEKFREHFNTTVPLLRFSKYVWTNDEVFSAKAQLSHNGEIPLSAECKWQVTTQEGEIYAHGSFGKNTFELGSLNDLGDIRIDLTKINKAQKLSVLVEVSGTEFKNSWDIWVFPNTPVQVENEDVLISDELDAATIEKLSNGGKVLLLAHNLGTDKTSVNAHYYPLYWSLGEFPDQGKTNIGLLLREDHPAFKNFPTSFHSDWQWETICNGAKGFILNDLPTAFKPIAQPVQDFHINNKLGSIFEVNVGRGALFVCGYNLETKLPAARQLKRSLLIYMNSADFNPQQYVDVEWLKQLLPSIPKAEAADIPKEFEGAILYINAGKNFVELNTSKPWNPKLDEVVISEKSSYTVKSGDVWKDDDGACWRGKQMAIKIRCPEGMLGSLYVYFRDPDNKKRTGILNFEGRKVKLEKHNKGGQWVKFHVMREDSKDGKLLLKTDAISGPNLMISKLILTAE